MECFNCSKISISEINCPFCSKNFCTFLCLETHMKSNHQINNSISKNNVYEKPKINRLKINKQNESILSSPYITYGFMAKNITYDKKYNLNNFIQEWDGFEPLVIGNGSYGRVYLYRNIIDKKFYAIKHMDKERLRKSLKTLQGIYSEIYYQSRIFHQNIVRLLNVKENEDSFDLIMEYANGGSLFYYIRDKNYLSEKESFKFFSQIINAVYFLHKNDLIHRDIKPENILLYDNNNICKLCDFGWCVKYDGRQRKTFCGTTEYMSPEIVNNIEYSKEIDVWSLGILLYEMVHGYSPFRPDKDDFNAKDVIENIKIHDLKFNNNISKECKELICHLLDENAENRYKIEDIFNSNFVKKYENKNLFFPKENINGLKKINNEVKPMIKINDNNKNDNNKKENIINKNDNNKNENIINKNENNINKIEFNINKTENINDNNKNEINNNIKNENNKNNISNNISSNYKLDFSQKRKIKNYASQKMYRTFLKNASIINKEKESNNKNIEINLKKNCINHTDNKISQNKIKDNSNPIRLSFEGKNKNINEMPSDANNKKENPLFNSASFSYLLNCKNSRKINLTEEKERILSNNESKKFNSYNINEKNKLQNNSQNDKIKNTINNKSNHLDFSSSNTIKEYNTEEKNNNLNKTCRTDNKSLNINKNNNKRKLNLKSYFYEDTIKTKKNSKDKDKKINKSENSKITFASVKKLSNENINNKNNINYNNYLTTYRDNSSKRKKYEQITIFNNPKKYSFSFRYLSGPKDNIKRKKNNSTINNSLNSTNNSKEKKIKRKIPNYLNLDKINNLSNNIDVLNNYYKIHSLENNYRLNSKILSSENTLKILTSENTLKYQRNNDHNNNLPTFEKTQINNNYNRTFRALPNNKLFKNNYSFMNNYYDKPQINTNIIFNPKISITLPSNPSFLPKSKNKNNSPKQNYKIIYLENNLENTNFKNLKNLAKSQSFIKTDYNKEGTENASKSLKNTESKPINIKYNSKRKKYESLNKKNEGGTNITIFSTERDKNKKPNLNINISSIFKGNESKYFKNKKYIKMNEITKYKYFNDNNYKTNYKTKKDNSDNINNISKGENIKNSINDNQKLIQPKKNSKEKKNTNNTKNLFSLKRMNHKIKLNIIANEKKIKCKSKEKKSLKNSFLERTLEKNTSKDKNRKKYLFSARFISKSKLKKNDDLQKTPKKDEDKIKIIPSRLLNNFSLEFNTFRNHGIK